MQHIVHMYSIFLCLYRDQCVTIMFQFISFLLFFQCFTPLPTCVCLRRPPPSVQSTTGCRCVSDETKDFSNKMSGLRERKPTTKNSVKQFGKRESYKAFHIYFVCVMFELFCNFSNICSCFSFYFGWQKNLQRQRLEQKVLYMYKNSNYCEFIVRNDFLIRMNDPLFCSEEGLKLKNGS